VWLLCAYDIAELEKGHFDGKCDVRHFIPTGLTHTLFFRITCVDPTVVADKSIVFTRYISREVVLSFINSLSLVISVYTGCYNTKNIFSTHCVVFRKIIKINKKKYYLTQFLNVRTLCSL